MIILTAITSDKPNAGPKAPRDIIDIICSHYHRVKSICVYNNKPRIWNLKRMYAILLTAIRLKEIIILQHPFTQHNILKILPKNRTIVIVHDLNSIRFPENPNNENEINLLNHFKYIIVHNNAMVEYLVNNGIDNNKLFINECFDYVCNDTKKTDDGLIKIVYAGNLEKSDFLYQIQPEKMNFELDIYGGGYQSTNNTKIHYKGVFEAENLPKEWCGHKLGLVFDGNYDESDENIGMKHYTKYNNPHKLSCYLAAGLPVIVWEKAAIAEFVRKNNIGYCINNIYDINKLDFSDIDTKIRNVCTLGDRIKRGYYTCKAIDSVLEEMNRKK